MSHCKLMQADDSLIMPRMVEIFLLRGLGYSQSEIATRISVSQQTVSYYLKLMKSKSEKYTPEIYFRSLLPYFSKKSPVIPTETRISATYVDSGVEAGKINVSYVDDMTKYMKDISEKLKTDRIEMDSKIKLFKSKDNNLYKGIITYLMLKKGFLANTTIYVSIAHTKNILHKYFKELDNIFSIIKKIEKKIIPKNKFKIKLPISDFKRFN